MSPSGFAAIGHPVLIRHDDARLGGERPRDLAHLERVRQAGAVVVPGGLRDVQKHLRLGFQAPERGGVQHAVAVFVKGGAGLALFLRVLAAPVPCTPGGVGGQGHFLARFQVQAADHARSLPLAGRRGVQPCFTVRP